MMGQRTSLLGAALSALAACAATQPVGAGNPFAAGSALGEGGAGSDAGYQGGQPAAAATSSAGAPDPGDANATSPPAVLTVVVDGVPFIAQDAVAAVGSDGQGQYLDVRISDQAGYCDSLSASSGTPPNYVDIQLRAAATGFVPGPFPVNAQGGNSATINFQAASAIPDPAASGTVTIVTAPTTTMSLMFAASSNGGSSIGGPVTASACQALADSLASSSSGAPTSGTGGTGTPASCPDTWASYGQATFAAHCVS